MINKFFVPNEVYEERIEICKGCQHYLSLLGNCGICKCFMKIKARLSPMECPKKYWQKTTEIETPEELPKELVVEIIKVWEDIKTGKAKNVYAKNKMIELYNTIFNTSYNPNTNCGSCISACFDGIKKLYKKYK